MLCFVESARRDKILSHVDSVVWICATTSPHKWLQLTRRRLPSLHNFTIADLLEILARTLATVGDVLALVYICILQVRALIHLIPNHFIHLLGLKADSLEHLLILNLVNLTWIDSLIL